MKKIFFISVMFLASILLVACNCSDCGKNEPTKTCLNEEQCCGCDSICSDEKINDSKLTNLSNNLEEVKECTNDDQCCNRTCSNEVVVAPSVNSENILESDLD